MLLKTSIILLSLATQSLQAKTIQDTRGRLVETSPRPERILSTSLASDEILLALLNDGCEPKRLLGISTLADNPKYSNITTLISSIRHRVGTNVESLYALKPDIVFAAQFNNPVLLETLASLKVKTFVLGGLNNIEAIKNNITIIGEFTHCKNQAESLLKNIEKKLSSLHSLPKRSSILGYGEGGMAIGTHTTFNSIISLAGAKNTLAAKKIKGWVKLSPEAFYELKPDYILLAAADRKEKDLKLDQLKKTPGWKNLKAVKEGKIIFLPQRDLASTSHYILKAIIKVNQILKETSK